MQFEFSLNYRKLNAVTVRDSYSILKMDKSINRLGPSSCLSSSNANWCFWEIELEQTNMYKTAFVKTNDLFRYMRK